MPDEDRSITALFVGGPKDGQTATFLGTIRTRPEIATSHFPGYRLRHDGGDPLSGWEMRLISDKCLNPWALRKGLTYGQQPLIPDIVLATVQHVVPAGQP
jgi:hypothetical protein